MKDQIHNIIPIILMGGYSTRMQQDKAFLQYKNCFWFQIVEKKLNLFFDKIYFSLRRDQFETQKQVLHNYQNQLIFDSNLPNIEGPLKGIFSTYLFFKHLPQTIFFLSQLT